ncbi:MAG: hypothetical protein LZ173_06715 [Thaumarchaeota archaeon]|nr:hypothetical protein [Candidatus Geocrenenecus arthurdayi]MCL7389607.1 hypothetical protein [Candidatus Geocrenenecus arthurdayi]
MAVDVKLELLQQKEKLVPFYVPSYVTLEDFLKFRKEFQERLALIEQKERFWKERLVYLSLLVASWTFILTKIFGL